MHIVIISPTYWEVFRFIRSEKFKKEGPTSYSLRRNNFFVQLEISGIGAENGRRACERLVQLNADLILCVGFAGGLKAEVKAGDIVLDGDKSDPKILSLVQILCGKRGFSCFAGKFWNSSAPLLRSGEKLGVSQKSSSLAVEMEGEAVWEFARSKGISFASVRSVSDTLMDDLPLAVTALGYQGKIGWNFWKIFVLRPWEWPAFFKLVFNSGIAGRNLQLILSNLIRDTHFL